MTRPKAAVAKVLPDDGKVWHFDILVADGFVLLEVASIIDTLRIANRISARPQFSWTYRSARGGIIESRCEAFVKTDPYVAKPDADYAFIIGNSDPDCPALSVGPVVDTYTYRNAQVFLLAEAASRFIKERKGSGRVLSTHWENQDFLRERAEQFDANYAIATEDGLVVTCAGMGATVDVVLAVMGRHIPSAAKMTVADVLLHERIRDFGSQQPFSGISATATGDKILDDCIELMQANIEEPLSIKDLVQALGVSNRSLERKFRAYMGTTPNTYYRALRLNRANNLLFNTSLSVAEIGLACGFPSGFSVQYKKFYGLSPLTIRKAKRAGRSR
jgi:transcriptional regulator GlxA family with amidase domain